MSATGESEDLLVRARSALLDALEALDEHRDAVIVIGAQAIYLHTGGAEVALAEATKDSDLALDPRKLLDDPLIETAMTRARFYPNPISKQPGAWMNSAGIPVDLMVPEELAGQGGARGARIPPHDNRSTRRARGLEAALVDNSILDIHALDDSDSRIYGARVAGPAALLVAKLHKIGERQSSPTRLLDKDAHDIYRLLVAVETEQIVQSLKILAQDPLSQSATNEAILYLETLFAASPESLGSAMAGRAEEGIGEPVTVALSVCLIAQDIMAGMCG